MTKYLRFIVIFLNLIYDIYKIMKKTNNSWSYSFSNKKIYGYSDFIIIDLKKIKIKEIFVFIFVITLYKILIKIQLCFFFYFLILYSIKSLYKKNNKICINKNIYERMIIDQPKYIAFILVKRLKNLHIPTKEEVCYLLININNVILWYNVKFVINNSIIITKFISNVQKDPNFKIEIGYINNKIKYLYKHVFDINLKNFEDTLLNGRTYL